VPDHGAEKVIDDPVESGIAPPDTGMRSDADGNDEPMDLDPLRTMTRMMKIPATTTRVKKGRDGTPRKVPATTRMTYLMTRVF
jgi:hypothetical protein